LQSKQMVSFFNIKILCKEKKMRKQKDLKIVQDFLALMADKERASSVKSLLQENVKNEKSARDINININIQGGK